MEYREVRPAPPLRRFLECFWFLGAAQAEDSISPAESVLPDGCTELIVHLGDPFRRVDGKGVPEIQPAAFFVGQMTRPMLLQPSRRARAMGIRFRPGGARGFLRLPLTELTDRSVPLDALWAGAGRDLEDALRPAATDRERIALAEAFLCARLANDPAPGDAPVEHAVRAILARRGRARVASLAARTGLSTRHFERRFRAAVGLSPKLFSRIVRFQHLVRIAPATDGWASAAAECGYFDQAHLVRDVRDFAGVSPSRLGSDPSGFSRHFVSEERLAALFDVGFVQDSARGKEHIRARGDFA